jgi:hypothetical protein
MLKKKNHYIYWFLKSCVVYDASLGIMKLGNYVVLFWSQVEWGQNWNDAYKQNKNLVSLHQNLCIGGRLHIPSLMDGHVQKENFDRSE